MWKWDCRDFDICVFLSCCLVKKHRKSTLSIWFSRSLILFSSSVLLSQFEWQLAICLCPLPQQCHADKEPRAAPQSGTPNPSHWLTAAGICVCVHEQLSVGQILESLQSEEGCYLKKLFTQNDNSVKIYSASCHSRLVGQSYTKYLKTKYAKCVSGWDSRATVDTLLNVSFLFHK